MAIPPYKVLAPNATSCTLILPFVTEVQAGLYGCVVDVAGGSALSAQLIVLGMKLEIIIIFIVPFIAQR